LAISSSVWMISMRPGPEETTWTSSPEAIPAARITSTGKVSWFLEEITLIPLQ